MESVPKSTRSVPKTSSARSKTSVRLGFPGWVRRQEFVDEVGVTYALGPDETNDIVVKHFKVTGFPTTVFLDKEHKVVRKWTGILDADKIEEFVQELLD